jgi:hypothetical protein
VVLVSGFDAPIRAGIAPHINANTLFLNGFFRQLLIMR